MNINTITQYVTYALALIGILAFIVSAIVQVIKGERFKFCVNRKN